MISKAQEFANDCSADQFKTGQIFLQHICQKWKLLPFFFLPQEWITWGGPRKVTISLITCYNGNNKNHYYTYRIILTIMNKYLLYTPPLLQKLSFLEETRCHKSLDIRTLYDFNPFTYSCTLIGAFFPHTNVHYIKFK